MTWRSCFLQSRLWNLETRNTEMQRTEQQWRKDDMCRPRAVRQLNKTFYASSARPEKKCAQNFNFFCDRPDRPDGCKKIKFWAHFPCGMRKSWVLTHSRCRGKVKVRWIKVVSRWTNRCLSFLQSCYAITRSCPSIGPPRSCIVSKRVKYYWTFLTIW